MGTPRPGGHRRSHRKDQHPALGEAGQRELLQSLSHQRFSSTQLAGYAHVSCQDHDPELWFVEGTRPKDAARRRRAVSVCAECPARSACTEVALADARIIGIWGGMTGKQRERVRSIRRRERTVGGPALPGVPTPGGTADPAAGPP